MESPSDSEVTLRSSSRSWCWYKQAPPKQLYFHCTSNSRCMRLSSVHSFVLPVLCDDPDELSLFLVSQKAQPRKGVEAGEGTVMLVTGPAQASWPGRLVFSLPHLGSAQREVFSPDPAERRAAAPAPGERDGT